MCLCPAALPQSSSVRPHQQSSAAPRYVAWAGAVSSAAGTIEVPSGLASALQLHAGTQVAIELLLHLAAAAAVTVEPVSAADWEVVELNAGLLEEMLLSQVGNSSRSTCCCMGASSSC